MHKTKIITTLGPATDSPEQLKNLLASGSSIARLNFSHGEDVWFSDTIAKIKAVNALHERPFSILVDTKGPEIRTRDTEKPISITGDQTYTIGFDAESKADILVDYPHLLRDIPVGQQVLIDGGTLTMHVTGHEKDKLVVHAEQSGSITSRRHFNVPGIHLDLPVLDTRDERLLKLSIEAGADMVALSFINQAKDIELVRKFIANITDRHITLIAKIETQMGLDRIEEIVQASDGIMIARGDLGIEIPMELLPTAQRHILAVCHRHGVPCIVATHMMKSMTENPTPTRAEIMDVGHAVYDGADCIMTSEETSVGAYPMDTVRLMARIAAATETSMYKQPAWHVPTLHRATPRFLQSALRKVMKQDANILVYAAESMATVRHMAALRLPVPCIALTRDPVVAKYAALCYGQNGCLVTEDIAATIPAKALRLAEEILGDKTPVKAVLARKQRFRLARRHEAVS